MSSGFVVIGWGSLLWDIDNLAPHVEKEWYLEQGPAIHLEFVRVSMKRKRALTLIIDPEHGEACGTSFVKSKRNGIELAASDLARREVTQVENIGMIDRRRGLTQSRHPQVQQAVAHWLEQTEFDGAVWTDLERNFDQVLGLPFSVDDAVRYLKGLQGESLREAKTYIDNAPRVVSTPLRRALQQDPWWQGVYG